MADPFSSWGPEESGVRLAETDARARGKDVLQAYETLGKIAMQPAHQELYTQQARHWKAQADQDELENSAMQLFRQSMSEQPQQQDELEQLFDTSRRAYKSGASKEGAAAATAAGRLIQQRATAERALSQAELAQIQGKIKQQERFANMAGAITDQTSNDIVAALYKQETGEMSPLEGKYDPKKAKLFQESTLTANQRLVAQARAVEERGRAAGRAETARFHRETSDIRREELARKEAADRIKEKSGGRGVGQPSPGALVAADLLLKANQPGLTDPLGKKLASQSIASRAMELIRGNRGLGRDEAMNQAYNEEVASGAFPSEPTVKLGPLGDWGTKTTFVRQGTREKPLPIPAGDNTEALKRLRTGKYYQTSKGLAKWNGSAFIGADETDDDDEEN